MSHLFVPGLTSNRRHFLDLHGEGEGTGRFGQGFLSIIKYLYPDDSTIPVFVFKNGSSALVPLLLNGELINDMPSPQVIIAGAFISFTPAFSRNGILRICEGGILITQLRIEDALVPQEMTLNFDRLPLSQERGNLDFRDDKTRTTLTALLSAIFAKLNDHEKGGILNALFPLIEKFNLMEALQTIFKDHSYSKKQGGNATVSRGSAIRRG